MPKVINLFDEPKKEKTAISFVWFMDEYGRFGPPVLEPKDFKYVARIRPKTMSDAFDLIAAWNDPDHIGVYLGRWNDGVIK